MTEEENAWDPDKLGLPLYRRRDPGPEDAIVYEITYQKNPFWVNEGPPLSVWAYWEGRYRLIDLDT